MDPVLLYGVQEKASEVGHITCACLLQLPCLRTVNRPCAPQVLSPLEQYDLLAGSKQRTLAACAPQVLSPLELQYDLLAGSKASRIALLVGHCLACVSMAPEAKSK